MTRTRVRRRLGSIPAGGLALIGATTLLVGAWAGAVPFVGPTFGYGADGSPAWTWNLPHTVLWLAPGAVGVVCGLLMIGLTPRALAGGARLGAATVGFVALVTGAWFVVGWLAWPLLQASPGVFAPTTAGREVLNIVGYALAPGAALIASGVAAMSWAVRSRRWLGPHVVSEALEAEAA
jgi:hypothetical protein